MGKTLTAKG